MFLNHFSLHSHPFAENPPIDWLLRDEVVLDPTRRRDLLRRLRLPDFPNLVPLIAEVSTTIAKISAN